MAPQTYKSSELVAAVTLASLVQAALVVLLVTAGGGRSLQAKEEEVAREVPIAVNPVIDDLPLLKLGSKQKPRLPQMWQPKPKPKPRYEDKSAPSPVAEKEPEKLPENEVAKGDEKPAPEDAELAKKVDEDIPEDVTTDDEELEMAEEGAEDGVAEGTETDPLKAFVVNQYRMKIIAWFKAGFIVPTDQLDCDTLAGLNTKVVAQVGPDRSLAGYAVSGPSGNAVFDGRVKSHMDRKVGGQLPPPPPKYSDILEATVHLNFSGKTNSCKSSKPSAPKQDSDSPGERADEEPPSSVGEGSPSPSEEEPGERAEEMAPSDGPVEPTPLLHPHGELQ